MNVRLLGVSNDDLPAIERWLNADHVRPTWGDPVENIRILREPPGEGQWRAVIETDGRKVGLVLWQHPSRRELDEAGLFDVPESVLDIDVMIGEPAEMGRGLGTAAIRLVAAAALSDPAVPFVIAAVRLDNHASRRAFAKAGFLRDRDFDDGPGGRHVLMVRRREGTGA
jgi:RimJ/RimL family protein N-acetyltransferase